MQEEPFAPLPLVMHANTPEESFAEHVSPAGQVNGLEAQPWEEPESEVDDEHAARRDGGSSEEDKRAENAHGRDLSTPPP